MRNPFRRDGRIIQSLLDTDFYKFTMGQFIFRYYRGVNVTFRLINRSGVPLARMINEKELRAELDHVRTLRFTNSELHYLRGTNEYGERMFSEDYLEFLKNMELPEYKLERVGDTYELEFNSPWETVTYWEIYALAIIKQLYREAQLRQMSLLEQDAVYATGITRLLNKIKILRQYPGLTFSDFGTRRRFSFAWQDYVVETTARELPKQFRGTSNVYLAMKHGLLPMGTNAHEVPMVAAALAFTANDEIIARGGAGLFDTDVLVGAQNEVLDRWYELYGEGLSIALTDTFGSDFFFRTAPEYMARYWKGTRQDSGDPIKYGLKALDWYKEYGVDTREKLIVFSDQLNVELMVRLYHIFINRINTTYGWGTDLTDDLGFSDPFSIVVKVAEVNGRSAVKLSDNLAKAMSDPAEIERYKAAAGYTSTLAVECKS